MEKLGKFYVTEYISSLQNLMKLKHCINNKVNQDLPGTYIKVTLVAVLLRTKQ